MKHKKLILSLILLASLTGILTATLLQPQPTPPFLPPTGTPATQTAKTPTVQNITQEMLAIYPSALENSTSVITYAFFNETFFNLNTPSEVTNILMTLTSLTAHYAGQGLNYSAPNTNILSTLLPTMITGGLYSLPLSQVWNETTGTIVVLVNGTDAGAAQNCNSAMEQLFNELQQKLDTTWGIKIQKLYNTTMITTVTIFGPTPVEVTSGILVFTTLNTLAEMYSFLEGLIPDNTFSKTIANKDSPSHIIQIGDYMMNISGAPPQYMGITMVGAVVEGQIGKIGNSYTFSTRNLLQPAGNITSQTPDSWINIYLPTTSNITNFYPPTADLSGSSFIPITMTPSISYYPEYEEALSVEDVNVTYTLESTVPYVVANYDMTNWNMNPGETANLTLTLTNVGTDTAYNVFTSLDIWDGTVMYFTETGSTWSGDNGPYTLAPGEGVVIDYNVTANNTGFTPVFVDQGFQRYPGGFTNYFNIGLLYVHVGSGPLLFYSADCSDWVVSPGDTVSVYFTARNVGNEEAYNVTTLFPSLGPVIDSNVTLPNPGQLWMLGDIPAGGAITANVTLEVDFFTFHTGGTPSSMMATELTAAFPLTLPGTRPSTAAHLEFEKYPEQVSVNVDDEVSVTVKVNNLGTETEYVTIMDSIPLEYFEVSEGNTNMSAYVNSGESVTLTYTLRAIKTGTVKLPPPAIGQNYTFAYSTRTTAVSLPPAAPVDLTTLILLGLMQLMQQPGVPLLYVVIGGVAVAVIVAAGVALLLRRR